MGARLRYGGQYSTDVGMPTTGKDTGQYVGQQAQGTPTLKVPVPGRQAVQSPQVAIQQALGKLQKEYESAKGRPQAWRHKYYGRMEQMQRGIDRYQTRLRNPELAAKNEAKLGQARNRINKLQLEGKPVPKGLLKYFNNIGGWAAVKENAAFKQQQGDYTQYVQDQKARKNMYADLGYVGGATGGVATEEIAPMYLGALQRDDALAKVGEQKLEQAQGDYQSLLTGAQDRENELTQYLTGLGENERRELSQDRERQQARATQGLVNRGLTTAEDSIRRGIDVDYSNQLIALNEKLTREKMDYRSALSGDVLSARKAFADNRRSSVQDWYGMASAGSRTLKDFGAAVGDQQRAFWGYKTGIGSAYLQAQSAMAQTASSERLGVSKLKTESNISARQRMLDRDKERWQGRLQRESMATQKAVATEQARAQISASPTGLAALKPRRRSRFS